MFVVDHGTKTPDVVVRGVACADLDGGEHRADRCGRVGGQGLVHLPQEVAAIRYADFSQQIECGNPQLQIGGLGQRHAAHAA